MAMLVVANAMRGGVAGGMYPQLSQTADLAPPPTAKAKQRLYRHRSNKRYNLCSAARPHLPLAACTLLRLPPLPLCFGGGMSAAAASEAAVHAARPPSSSGPPTAAAVVTAR